MFYKTWLILISPVFSIWLNQIFCSLPFVPCFFSSLGYTMLANNDVNDRVPSIWVLISVDIGSFNVISLHAQHVTASFMINETLMYGSFIYTSTSSITRRTLWNSLFDLSIQGPWFAIGDFNPVLTASCMDLAAIISLCNWVELDSQGFFHTWRGTTASGIVLSRLDRAFCNEAFLDSWS